MLQRQRGLTGGDVPELDAEVSRCRSEDVLGGRVEADLADLPVQKLEEFDAASSPIIAMASLRRTWNARPACLLASRLRALQRR